MRLARLFLAASLVALLFAVAADAAPVRAVVKSVKGGDTAVLKVGKKNKTFDLSGLNAPEPADCFGAQATTKLKSLLKKGKAVKAIVHGKTAEIMAGKVNVNRLMVAGGFARAN